MNNTINVEDTIQEINRQNKRIEKLCLEIERLNNMLENDSAKNLELIELINKISDVAENNNITGIEARLKILEILEN